MRKIVIVLLLMSLVSYGVWAIPNALSLTVCPDGNCEVSLSGIELNYGDNLIVIDDDVSAKMINVPLCYIAPGSPMTIKWKATGALEQVAWWELRFGTGDDPAVIISNQKICSQCVNQSFDWVLPKDLKGNYLKLWIWAFDKNGQHLGGANSRPISLSENLIAPIGFVSQISDITPRSALSHISIVSPGNKFPLSCWVEIAKLGQEYNSDNSSEPIKFESLQDVKDKCFQGEIMLKNLSPKSDYVCRVILISLSGQCQGAEYHFQTPADNPYAQTDWPSDVTLKEMWWNSEENIATLNATLYDWGGDSYCYYYFEGTCLNNGQYFTTPLGRIEYADYADGRPAKLNAKKRNLTTGWAYEYRICVYNSNGNIFRGDPKYISPGDATYYVQVETWSQAQEGYSRALLEGQVIDLGNQDRAEVTFQYAHLDTSAYPFIRPSGKIFTMEQKSIVTQAPQKISLWAEKINSCLSLTAEESTLCYRIMATGQKTGMKSYGTWEYLRLKQLAKKPIPIFAPMNPKTDVGNNYLRFNGSVWNRRIDSLACFEFWDSNISNPKHFFTPWQKPEDKSRPYYQATALVVDGELSLDGTPYKIEPGRIYNCVMHAKPDITQADDELIALHGSQWFEELETSEPVRQIRTWFADDKGIYSEPKITIEAFLEGDNTISIRAQVLDFGGNDYVMVETEWWVMETQNTGSQSMMQMWLDDPKMPDPKNPYIYIANPDHNTPTAHIRPDYYPIFKLKMDNLQYSTRFRMRASAQGNSGKTGFSRVIELPTKVIYDKNGEPIKRLNPYLAETTIIPRLIPDNTTHTYTLFYEIQVATLGTFKWLDVSLCSYRVDNRGNVKIASEKKSDTIRITQPQKLQLAISELTPGETRKCTVRLEGIKMVRTPDLNPLIGLPNFPPNLSMASVDLSFWNKERKSVLAQADIAYPGSSETFAMCFVYGPEDLMNRNAFDLCATTPWRSLYLQTKNTKFFDELKSPEKKSWSFENGKTIKVMCLYRDLAGMVYSSQNTVSFTVPKQ